MAGYGAGRNHHAACRYAASHAARGRDHRARTCRTAPGRDGYRGSAMALRPPGTTEPPGPETRARHQPRTVPRATVGPFAVAIAGHRNRRPGSAHCQYVARLSRESQCAGTGGTLYRRLPGFFHAGAIGDTAAPAVGLAARGWPAQAAGTAADSAGRRL